MTRLQRLAAGVLGILVASSAAFAHHAWPVDRATQVTVTGTVTDFRWANPHVMIALDVQASNGAMEKWEVGGPSPNRMTPNGWNKDTLKPGDVITGTGWRFRDGSNVLQLEKIVMAGGREMLLYGRR
jgi:hypothetical protein